MIHRSAGIHTHTHSQMLINVSEIIRLSLPAKASKLKQANNKTMTNYFSTNKFSFPLLVVKHQLSYLFPRVRDHQTLASFDPHGPLASGKGVYRVSQSLKIERENVYHSHIQHVIHD